MLDSLTVYENLDTPLSYRNIPLEQANQELARTVENKRVDKKSSHYGEDRNVRPDAQRQRPRKAAARWSKKE